METIKEKIRDLKDSEIVTVINSLYDRIFTNIPADAMAGNISTLPEIKKLKGLDETTLMNSFSATESVQLARLLIDHLSDNPSLFQIIENEIDKIKASKEMFIGTILTVGLVVNLTVLLATSKIEVKKSPSGKIAWKVIKKDISPDLAEKFFGPFFKLFTGVISH